ncbi:NUDIX domain-containing protein [Paenibacillus oceani]|uniref:NUDIX domain-containing protein n=1 Tax=Paenibacillus oceani TaxID=2772510 RepID=A0A927CG27_9BACL|nr:NUDIX domain-containing protein [Paenibacillus oceani]MBD2866003.1 NUDIX domain-containing protein [Paenibacillus oceani]
MNVVCAAGGLIVRNHNVLLVKTTYGANRGLWMIPGGLVEPGETFEMAAIREVYEETGITAQPRRLIAVRSGIKETAVRSAPPDPAACGSPRPEQSEHGVYLVYEMEPIPGTPEADGLEIAEARYRPIDEVLDDPEVVGLSRQIIHDYVHSAPASGLTKVRTAIRANQQYALYEVYTLA